MKFGFNNVILEETKNIYGNALIPWKSHWNIGLLKDKKSYERFQNLLDEAIISAEKKSIIHCLNWQENKN